MTLSVKIEFVESIASLKLLPENAPRGSERVVAFHDGCHTDPIYATESTAARAWEFHARSDSQVLGCSRILAKQC